MDSFFWKSCILKRKAGSLYRIQNKEEKNGNYLIGWVCGVTVVWDAMSKEISWEASAGLAWGWLTAWHVVLVKKSILQGHKSLLCFSLLIWHPGGCSSMLDPHDLGG